MSTVKKLVYTIWRKLDGGNISDDSKYTYREIRGYVISVIADALKRNFYEHLNAGEYKYGDDGISTTYKNLKVVENEEGLKTVALPARIISTPGGRGINVHSSNRVNKWSTTFIPVRQEEVFVGGLQKPIPCVVLYYQEDNNLVFYNGILHEDNVSVTLKYSLPLEGDDDKELNLPEEYATLIVRGVLEILSPALAQRDNDINGVDDN